MCDLAREDASVIISDLRDIGINRDGSISLSAVDSTSDFATAATGHDPNDAIWEERAGRTHGVSSCRPCSCSGMATAPSVWATFVGSASQPVGTLVAGTLTLFEQRLLPRRGRRRHLQAREVGPQVMGATHLDAPLASRTRSSAIQFEQGDPAGPRLTHRARATDRARNRIGTLRLASAASWMDLDALRPIARSRTGKLGALKQAAIVDQVHRDG